MIRRVASTPSMTGMIRSIRIRSGRSAAASVDRLGAVVGRPGDRWPGTDCDHAAERLAGQGQVVDDPDPHPRQASPIRSATVSRNVWSWKLLLVR